MQRYTKPSEIRNMLYIKTLIYLMENIMKIRKSCKLMLSEKHILGQKSLNQWIKSRKLETAAVHSMRFFLTDEH